MWPKSVTNRAGRPLRTVYAVRAIEKRVLSCLRQETAGSLILADWGRYYHILEDHL